MRLKVLVAALIVFPASCASPQLETDEAPGTSGQGPGIDAGGGGWSGLMPGTAGAVTSCQCHPDHGCYGLASGSSQPMRDSGWRECYELGLQPTACGFWFQGAFTS